MKKIIFLMLFIFSYYCQMEAKATDLIIYKDVLDNSKISLDQLLLIFTKKQRFWENGQKITVFIKPINSIEHSVFSNDILGISVYRYKKILKKHVYSGKSGSVKEVLSDNEMIRLVTTTPFSIGYLTDGSSLIPLHGVSDTNITLIDYD